DDYFETLLKEDDLLTLPGNHLLLEMSFLAAPSKLEDYLFQSRLKGYQLILAHPERYIYLRKQYSQYERLRDLGCKFQVNLLSLIGYYGKEIKKNAFRLLKNGWVEYLGTDCHHGQHLELLTKAMHRGEFNFPKINFENNTIAPA
ncbi:MAG: CpsB/CapC family capsule biosynthesis tyrosine phosphatase, partial [Saprospiraceae bacterium]